ncbi:MAG: EamA family transporter [Gammaproteobacteria bacterium]|nr:EamA family transporter [Gammaproteobacteria bacterium]
MRSQLVYGLVIGATVFWGANFELAGPVLADLPPLWAAALRFLLGAMIMFMIARVRKEDLVSAARAHFGVYLLLGLVGIGAFNLFFFYAMEDTSAVNAALIMATNPLLTTLLAALVLGERPNARHLFGLPLALLGVTIVISGGNPQRLLNLHIARGDILMLLANTAWAIYNILVRRLMPARSALTNTTLVMTAGAAVLFIVALSTGGALHLPGVKAGTALILMTLGGTVLAYLFWNTAIARLGAGHTALFLNLVPVFAMLIGITLGSVPSLPQFAGGILVMSGISLSMLPKRQPALRQETCKG